MEYSVSHFLLQAIKPSLGLVGFNITGWFFKATVGLGIWYFYIRKEDTMPLVQRFKRWFVGTLIAIAVWLPFYIYQIADMAKNEIQKMKTAYGVDSGTYTAKITLLESQLKPKKEKFNPGKIKFYISGVELLPDSDLTLIKKMDGTNRKHIKSAGLFKKFSSCIENRFGKIFPNRTTIYGT